jgi:hypothetical protein
VLQSDVQRMTAVLENFVEIKTVEGVTNVSAAAVCDSIQNLRGEVQDLRSTLSSFIEVKTAEEAMKTSFIVARNSMQDLRGELQELRSILAGFVEAKIAESIKKISASKQAQEKESDDLMANAGLLQQQIASVEAQRDALKTSMQTAMGGPLPTASGPLTGHPGTVAAHILTAQPAEIQSTIVAPGSSRGIVVPSYVSDPSGPQASIRRPEQKTSTIWRARVSPDHQAHHYRTVTDTVDTGE